MLRSESMMAAEKIQDVHQYLVQTYPDQTKQKHRRSSSSVSIAIGSTMPQELEKEYGELLCFTSQMLAEWILTKKTLLFPESNAVTPLEIACRYSELGTTGPDLLVDYHTHLARKWCIDPELKQAIREAMYTNVRIDVRPTSLGYKQIDSIHPLANVKYIRHKPVNAFKKSVSWLALVKGEDDGLLKCDIKCDFSKLREVDVGEGLWADERRLILNAVINGDLFSTFQKYVRERLLREATDELAACLERELLDKIDMCGLTTKRNICSVKQVDNKICFVQCDTQGVYNQKLWINCENMNPESRQFVAKKLLLFIQDECEFVCYGSQSVRFVKLMREVETLVDEMRQGSDEYTFVVVDDECARIYAESARAKNELNYLTATERYCMSIARKLIDPVMEYAGLVNSSNEIRLLKLHPMQHVLSEERFNQVIDLAFIKIIYLSGVDINLAQKHSHMLHTLQFVSGLGPRKAQSIMANLQNAPLVTRSDLVTRNIVSMSVFINCASFIRIKSAHFKRKKHEDELDVLDDTRIHPEDYHLARQMASDTLQSDDEYDQDDDASTSVTVKILLKKDRKVKAKILDDLDLESFSAQLESQDGSKPKSRTLKDIKEELITPFKDYRRRFSKIDDEVLFTLLTQETNDTLYVGMIIGCQVERIFDKGVRVRLSAYNLDGFIGLRNLGDGFVSSCSDVVKQDQFMNCCVLEVDRKKFSVELNAKPGDVYAAIKSTAERLDSKRDEYYSKTWDDDGKADADAADARLIKNKPVRDRRIIKHSLFKDMDYKEAEAYLRDRKDGEVVIRPSTKGNEHLSITWRIYDGIILHIDIKEVMERGKIEYKMDDKTYKHLDELLDKAVGATNQYISQLVRSPKFHKFDAEAASVRISQECKSSRRSQYGFVLSREKPGRAILVYKHSDSDVRQEVIGISEAGFSFRERSMGAVVDIVQFFKVDEAKKSKAKLSQSNLPPRPSSSSGQQARPAQPMRRN